jgi:molybdenum cofactor cytidylyltransferase
MTAAIILAAGESGRLGRPKQNLLFQNKTLLQHAIETGLRSKCSPVVVVLGANADKITPQLPDKAFNVIYNKNWKEGIASSIRIAIKDIEKDISISDVLIMLCDQPFVTSDLIGKILQKKAETQSPIIACSYQNTAGVPALFDRSLFTELSSLSGDEGAKKIIKGHSKDVADVPFDLGSFDIDTQADYARLIKERC